MLSIKSSALIVLSIPPGITFLIGILFSLAGLNSMTHEDPKGSSLLIFGMVLSAVASVPLWFTLSTLFEKYWILKYGVPAKAVVIKIEISRGNVRTIFEYYVSYQYEDRNGKKYLGMFVVPGPIARTWFEGKEISIRYNKNHPNHSIGLSHE